jgi:hypothetical protein
VKRKLDKESKMAEGNNKKYSFSWSESDLKHVSDEAEKYREDYKKTGNYQPGIPICFFGEGNYIFRIYPDRDPNGFARIIKKAYFHNRKVPVEGLYLRFWEDDRINKLFREAEEAGLEKIWGNFLYMYRSQERGYMMAHLYESPPGNEYALAKKSYGVVLDRRQVFAIQDFIAELHPEDKRSLLDPNNAAPAIKLSITRGSGKANVSCGIAGMQRLELPPLEFKDEDGSPIEYTGLDNIYIKETDKISDEDFFKLRKAVSEEIANFKASGTPAKDLSSEAHKFGDGGQKDSGKEASPKETKQNSNPGVHTNPLPDIKPTESKSSSGSTEAETVRCRLAEQTMISPSLKETYPNAAFGNKPEKNTPYCMVCDFEEPCKELTAKRMKAAE